MEIHYTEFVLKQKNMSSGYLV